MLNAVIGMMGAITYDVDAQAYFNQLTVQPSSAFKLAINNLVIQLKADGNWTKLDRLWIHATEIQQHARVSLVNPTSTQITEGNSPTFTANQGYTGNGTSMFLNTNWRLSDGVNFLQNDASWGLYCRTNLAAATYEAGVSVPTTSNGSTMNTRWTDGVFYANINGGGFTQATVANSLGLFAVRRTSSTACLSYKNGTQVDSRSLTSVSRPATNLFILALNTGVGPSSFTSKQISLTFSGSGSINQSTFYNAIQTFATTRGFNV